MKHVGIDALKRFKENLDEEYVKKQKTAEMAEKIKNNAEGVEKNTASLTWQ